MQNVTTLDEQKVVIVAEDDMAGVPAEGEEQKPKTGEEVEGGEGETMEEKPEEAASGDAVA